LKIFNLSVDLDGHTAHKFLNRSTFDQLQNLRDAAVETMKRMGWAFIASLETIQENYGFFTQRTDWYWNQLMNKYTTLAPAK